MGAPDPACGCGSGFGEEAKAKGPILVGKEKTPSGGVPPAGHADYDINTVRSQRTLPPWPMAGCVDSVRLPPDKIDWNGLRFL